MKTSEAMEHPVIFYDGVCGLCDGLTQFVLKRDRKATFRFAPLQSEVARRALASKGADPSDLDTIRVLTPGGGLMQRGEAVVYILSRMEMPWRLLSILGIMPRGVLDTGYRLVARYRYRVFGQYAACPVPDARWRDRFIA
jgi:predicted DCC family thiol-disulfide oxidoreductase YuxK